MSNESKLPVLQNWDHAPEWAMYRCIDSTGDLEYHELEPEPTKNFWYSYGRETVAGFNYDATDWKNSLQKRPEQ